MKKLIFLFLLLCLPAKAQISQPPLLLNVPPVGDCPNGRFAFDITAGSLYYCAGNAWIQAIGSVGGSFDLSLIPDASTTQRGLVSTEAQIFGGNKTFQGDTVNDGDLYVTGQFSTDHPIETTIGDTCVASEANTFTFCVDPLTNELQVSIDGSAPSSVIPTRFVSGGTALVGGDFALHANWGASATIGTITGTDQAFQFTVTSAGAGQGANPTVTLTFKDGTWTTVPIFTCNMNGGTGALSFTTVVPTATTAVITYIGTPTVDLTYTISCVGMGI